MLKNNIIKIIRLVVYLIKGDFDYSFKQYKFTNALLYLAFNIKYAKNTNERTKAVVFDLNDGSLGRYIFTLINIFKVNNYSIYIIPKKKFYATCSGIYIVEIFRFLHINILYSKKQLSRFKERLFVTDNNQNEINITALDKTIILRIDNLDFTHNKIVIPFSFHPLIYIKNSLLNCVSIEKFINSNSKEERKVSVFFGGQIYHESYNKLNKSFPEIINRNEFFATISQKFYSIVNPKWELSPSNTDKQKIVILNRKDSEIKPESWFSFLGDSDFFLCPPGFEMPMCHNVIEAMACGCIPIIQYFDLFSPSLMNNVTCLAFSNKTELEQTITKALEMNKIEIEQLRINVKKYYKEHLSPISYILKLEEVPAKRIASSLIAGEHSIKEKRKHVLSNN